MNGTEPLISPDLLWTLGTIAGGIVILVLWFFWWKGRLIQRGSPGEVAHVFRASRLSRGNLFFPTQVVITPTSIIHYTPQWIGRREHSIHLAHVASIRIDTNLLFSDVLIESSGGTSTVSCYGHSKGDAVRIKDLVERYQSDHYRKV